MASPANLPFLLPLEFKLACDSLLRQVQTRQSTFWETAEVKEVNAATVLIINKCIEDTESSGARSLEQDGENRVLDEDDGEVIFVSPSASSPVCVEYSCVLHRIYQVPVLYFTFKNKIGRKQYTIDDVYSLLIPKDQHTHLCDVGVLGAVTMGEHLVSGRPAFFVHPCNTAEAVRNLSRGVHITLDNYLQLWLGLVGPVVGLHLPLPLQPDVALPLDEQSSLVPTPSY